MKRYVMIVSLLSAAAPMIYAGIAEDIITAKTNVSDDFTETSTWLSKELAEGMAYNAGAGNALPADVIEFPGFSLGVSGGITSWPVDAGEFKGLPFRTIDPELIAMADSMDMQNFFGFVKAALPWGLDFGMRIGRQPFDNDEGGADIEVDNTIWGVELRKRMMGGIWTNILLPDLSLNLSFGNAIGTMDRTEHYEDNTRSEYYDGTKYNQQMQADTVWETKWNVQNVGLKAVISKTFFFFTPYLGLSLDKHMGTLKTKIKTDGMLSIERPSTSISQNTPLHLVSTGDVDAHDMLLNIITGIELKYTLLRLALTGEFSGDYKAYHALLRIQFR